MDPRTFHASPATPPQAMKDLCVPGLRHVAVLSWGNSCCCCFRYQCKTFMPVVVFMGRVYSQLCESKSLQWLQKEQEIPKISRKMCTQQDTFFKSFFLTDEENRKTFYFLELMLLYKTSTIYVDKYVIQTYNLNLCDCGSVFLHDWTESLLIWKRPK